MSGTVPIPSMIFMAVSCVIGFGLPLAAFLYLRLKKKADVLPFFIGCAVMLLFALILEALVHRVILGSSAGGKIQNNIWLYALYGGLMAGLFEETGRFLAFKTVLKKYQHRDVNALMYGAGHGGIEAVVLLGITMINNLTYSVIINAGAFAIGYLYFNSGNKVLQIVFIAALFLIGLQFGASNLLPTMFQADVLEDIELKTGKRLDATLPTVIGVGTMISGTIATALAPRILYGEHSIIHYIQPSDLDPNPVQSLKTKIAMLFFYTVFHGLMMFLAGVPFFFYKLTGQTKEEIHNAVIRQREQYNND